ncbi:MAG TPA: hypothetical protein PK109_01365 [Candidatus Paceibacterota bacterium]|nr:hypothetical protein [Candidatus Paceibacterota bacterium]
MEKKNALLMAYDKAGIADFARGLMGLGYNIYGSKGTVAALAAEGIAATDIATIVGDPILGHRVVSLSREIFAGILARDIEEDRAELKAAGITWFDLVCVDFYPLQQELADPAHTKESVIEKTDIGGPTAVRAAAKAGRVVVCDPGDRERVLAWLSGGRPDEEAFLDELAAKAEALVSRYVLASAEGRSNGGYAGLIGKEVAPAKYGENAYQAPAALYSGETTDPLALDRFTVIEGTAPSYNNWCDIDRLLQTATHIAAAYDVNRGKTPNIAVGAKHGNACGAAQGENPEEVLKNMLAGDPLSIFGGLVLVNFPIDDELSEILAGNMLDGIIAPSFSEGARDRLRRKGDRCRFIENSALLKLSKDTLDTAARFRYVRGGFLRQPNYTFVMDLKHAELVKHGTATRQQEDDMLLAWAVGATSNSNTIALVKNGMLLGNGVGQQDRVGAANLGLVRATRSGHDVTGAVAYSDSFFPFPDAPEVLFDAGVTAILSTSGSKNDQLSIDLAASKNLALYLIPDSLGRGFFGH